MRLRTVSRVCWRQAHYAPDRTIRKKFIIRAQRGIRDGPLAVRILHRLVVLPLIWIGSIVHAHLEILGAREEKIAVVGKLAGIASRVIVNDGVGLGRGNESLGDDVAAEPLPPDIAQAELSPHQAIGQLLSAQARVFGALVRAKGARGHELATLIAGHLLEGLATPPPPAPGPDAAVASVVRLAVVIVIQGGTPARSVVGKDTAEASMAQELHYLLAGDCKRVSV